MTHETFVFLPWLRLQEPIEIYDLIFCPIGKQKGFSLLPDYAVKQANLIASSYTDQAGHSVPDFTIVLRKSGEKPHNLTDQEHQLAREAASILFFCSWSLNDYYTQLGSYSNSSLFNIIGQRFTPTDPRGVALTLRRRDGETLSGGYSHGQVRFVCPSQYAINHESTIDTSLLGALMTARGQGAAIFDLFLSVMVLIELANSDRDFINQSSEIILMGSAFETFLDLPRSPNKAIALSEAFSNLFSRYSSLTVADAVAKGRTIYLDPKDGAQNTWSIFKAWSHELYKLRNEYVHSKKTPNRTWGWYELEHLVIAAFAFPLVVKIKLAEEKFYSLTNQDKTRCFALGELLITPDWGSSEHPGSFNNTFKDILSNASWSQTKDEILAELKNKE